MHLHIITFIYVIIMTIVVTNIDNIIMMIIFVSLPQFKPMVVGLGYFLAMVIILILVYVVGFLAAKVLPVGYVRYLGILLIVFGIFDLVKTIYHSKLKHKKALVEVKQMPPFQQLIFNTMTQLACAIDSLVIFVPILMKHKGDLSDSVFAITFVITIAVIPMVIILSGRFIQLSWIKRFGHYVMSPVLILVGTYILYF